MIDLLQCDDIKKAVKFANEAFNGQQRKTGELNIDHACRVGWIAYLLDMHMDYVVAGILHDVVEDTEVTIDDIYKEFKEVWMLVDALTNQYTPNSHPNLNRRKRKQLEITRLRREEFRGAKRLKLIDRYDNVRDIEKLTPGFVEVYKQESIALAFMLYDADPTLAEQIMNKCSN